VLLAKEPNQAAFVAGGPYGEAKDEDLPDMMKMLEVYAAKKSYYLK